MFPTYREQKAFPTQPSPESILLGGAAPEPEWIPRELNEKADYLSDSVVLLTLMIGN